MNVFRNPTPYVVGAYSYAKEILWSPFYYGIESYIRLRKICGDKPLVKWAFMPTAITLALSYGLYRAQLWQYSIGDQVFQTYSKFGDEQTAGQEQNLFYEEFLPKLLKMGAAYAFTHAISVLNDGMQKFSKLKLSEEVLTKYHERMFASDNYIALTEQNILPRIRGAEDDLQYLVETSSAFVTSGITVSTLAAISISALYSASLQIPVALCLWGTFGHYVSSKILAKTKQINDAKVAASSDYHAVRHYDLNYAQNIVALDGLAFTNRSLDERNKIVFKHRIDYEIYNTVNSVWNHVHGVLSFMLRWSLLGYHTSIGNIKFSHKSVVEVASEKISDLFQWNTRSAQSVLFTITGMARLDGVLKVLDDHEAKTNKIYLNFNDDKPKISLSKDLLISIIGAKNNAKLYESPTDVELEKGKRYCLIAPSGQGKTTLLYALKGIIPNGISISGSVMYPFKDSKKLIMIPQQDYFPKNTTLLEIICYPNPPTTEDNRVKSLMTRLIIDADNNMGIALADRLNDKADWENILSGGQKKKIKLISAILKDPEVMLLDETFAGLDDRSIVAACEVIRTDLPNATIILVDHKYESLPHGFITDYLHLKEAQLNIETRSV